MFDATQQDVSCGGGVGWGGYDDVPLHLHTCLMLRNRMFLSDLDICLMLRNRMFLSYLDTCLSLTFICLCIMHLGLRDVRLGMCEHRSFISVYSSVASHRCNDT